MRFLYAATLYGVILLFSSPASSTTISFEFTGPAYRFYSPSISPWLLDRASNGGAGFAPSAKVYIDLDKLPGGSLRNYTYQFYLNYPEGRIYNPDDPIQYDRVVFDFKGLYRSFERGDRFSDGGTNFIGGAVVFDQYGSVSDWGFYNGDDFGYVESFGRRASVIRAGAYNYWSSDYYILSSSQMASNMAPIPLPGSLVMVMSALALTLSIKVFRIRPE